MPLTILRRVYRQLTQDHAEIHRTLAASQTIPRFLGVVLWMVPRHQGVQIRRNLSAGLALGSLLNTFTHRF